MGRYSADTESNHINHKKKMKNCRKCQYGKEYGY